MTALLASVRTAEEALLLQQEQADIIDLKAPENGALGALPASEIRIILEALAGNSRVSATIGDLPTEPEHVVPAVQAMSRQAVDYIKLGFFPGGDWQQTMQQLGGNLARTNRLIGVFFAECPPAPEDIRLAASCGFAGVMLDTMDKARGPITGCLNLDRLRAFANAAREQRLYCGLAGSLRACDIAALLPLEVDYLGFRGALCNAHDRTGQLAPESIRLIRSMIPRENRVPGQESGLG